MRGSYTTVCGDVTVTLDQSQEEKFSEIYELIFSYSTVLLLLSANLYICH